VRAGLSMQLHLEPGLSVCTAMLVVFLSAGPPPALSLWVAVGGWKAVELCEGPTRVREREDADLPFAEQARSKIDLSNPCCRWANQCRGHTAS
jgi:hypothetical protein